LVVSPLHRSAKEATMIHSVIKAEVDRLFKEASVPYGELCRNPVTGGEFVWGLDPIAPQKNKAYKALLAQQLFALIGPPDAPPLPLSRDEREKPKRGGLPHILAWFARSLASRNFDLMKHPSFEDYARGVMASKHAPGFITRDQQLQKRFPPRQLAGLVEGLYWDPPKERVRTSCRRSRARAAA
jgi:hypothetical protein